MSPSRLRHSALVGVCALSCWGRSRPEHPAALHGLDFGFRGNDKVCEIPTSGLICGPNYPTVTSRNFGMTVAANVCVPRRSATLPKFMTNWLTPTFTNSISLSVT